MSAHRRCQRRLAELAAVADGHGARSARGSVTTSPAGDGVSCVVCGERGMSPRPSTHPPLTKSYAIDQITDIEHLRRVAHRMWEAFFAAHSQAAHAFGALLHIECAECAVCFGDGDGDEAREPCAQWREWQRAVDAGFGSV